MRHIVVESILIAALVGSPALAETEHASEPDRYCVTEIGDLPGRTSHSYAQDINERGQVLGNTIVADRSRVFIWDRNHGTVDFTAPTNAANFAAMRINDSGQIVGTRYTGVENEIIRAVLWDPVRGFLDLGTLPGDTQSGGGALNNRGQVVGSSVTGFEGTIHGFLWDKRFGMRALPDLPGSIGGNITTDINDAGEVAGRVTTVAGVRAYIWDRHNGIRAIGSLPEGSGYSGANGLNERGEVVGTSSFGDGDGLHAFVWNSADGMVDLGDWPGGREYSQALAINDGSHIVGFATDEDDLSAALWDARRRMHDLNELIDRARPETQFVRVTLATAINNAGWIAAIGGDSRDDTIQRSYVLIPQMRGGRGPSACR